MFLTVPECQYNALCLAFEAPTVALGQVGDGL